MSELRERPAEYAHGAWSGWLKYQFGKGTFNADGTWTMPAWAVERWKRQAETDYANLPESEKESDRAEADKMLAILFGDVNEPDSLWEEINATEATQP